MRDGWIGSLEGALAQLPGPDPEDDRYAEIFRHGTLSVLIYAPRGSDPQTPHKQDELYVVANGRGTAVVGGTRKAVDVHDVIFVPAGVEHRFEDFTGDFAVGVFFYGQKGGEAADASGPPLWR
jgi:quercetin dioxygenase-like cupin family protein